MKPIWYFVGLILLAMGGIIFLTGVYYLFNTSSHNTVLANTHPNLWWGLIMVAFGALLYLKNRNKIVE